MNKRIQKLAMKYANKMGNSVIHNTEHLENFAELIVRECADFLSLGGGDGYEDGERLKRHFGVEK